MTSAGKGGVMDPAADMALADMALRGGGPVAAVLVLGIFLLRALARLGEHGIDVMRAHFERSDTSLSVHAAAMREMAEAMREQAGAMKAQAGAMKAQAAAMERGEGAWRREAGGTG